MIKSRRKALRTLTREKIVNIGDYRNLKTGRSMRRVAIVSTDKDMVEALHSQLDQQAELQVFDSRFSLEQALRAGEWDGVLLDERILHEDALQLCEKIKRNTKFEDLFVLIISNNNAKDVVREGYEKGCDDWITRLDDVTHLTRLLTHHLTG